MKVQHNRRSAFACRRVGCAGWRWTCFCASAQLPDQVTTEHHGHQLGWESPSDNSKASQLVNQLLIPSSSDYRYRCISNPSIYNRCCTEHAARLSKHVATWSGGSFLSILTSATSTIVAAYQLYCFIIVHRLPRVPCRATFVQEPYRPQSAIASKRRGM